MELKLARGPKVSSTCCRSDNQGHLVPPVCLTTHWRIIRGLSRDLPAARRVSTSLSDSEDVSKPFPDLLQSRGRKFAKNADDP